MKRKLLALLTIFTVAGIASAQDAPIKALLVSGGGYHDYANQKNILSEGITKRSKVTVEIAGDDPAQIKERLSKAGWADNYDVVIYNFCDAGQKDNDYIAQVVAAHKDGGKGAVMVHCALHSYHWNAGEGGKKNFSNKEWVKLVGVGSPGHGPKDPIHVTSTEAGKAHPVLKGIPAEWTTPEGELYFSPYIAESATVLANGINKLKKSQAVVWTNQYGKAKVVGISLGHHNSTMKTDAYLNMVTNSVIWAAGK